MRRIDWVAYWVGACAACGGAAPLPAASPQASDTPEIAPAAAPAAKAAPLGTAIRTTPAALTANAPDQEDPDEMPDPAMLKPLLALGGHPAFPPRNVGDHECWQTLALSGDAAVDYRALVEHCGKATGSIEYAKPASGRLDHMHDRRDTFILPIRKGLCYRFFGVADATIPDLDILIERDGALVGSDKTNGPVVIIDSDKAWCMDRDGQFSFHVQVHGEGQGKYVFGAWARAH